MGPGKVARQHSCPLEVPEQLLATLPERWLPCPESCLSACMRHWLRMLAGITGCMVLRLRTSAHPSGRFGLGTCMIFSPGAGSDLPGMSASAVLCLGVVTLPIDGLQGRAEEYGSPGLLVVRRPVNAASLWMVQVCKAGLTRVRKIWFSRHGESEYNMYGKIGGDSNISPQGQMYAKLLPELLVDRVPLVSCGQGG